MFLRNIGTQSTELHGVISQSDPDVQRIQITSYFTSLPNTSVALNCGFYCTILYDTHRSQPEQIPETTEERTATC
jgi:hypothetical protein